MILLSIFYGFYFNIQILVAHEFSDEGYWLIFQSVTGLRFIYFTIGCPQISVERKHSDACKST